MFHRDETLDYSINNRTNSIYVIVFKFCFIFKLYF